MTIPPIIPGLHQVGAHGNGKAGGHGDVTKRNADVAAPEDVVNISNAARARLDGVRVLSSGDAGTVQTLAGETRGILEETDFPLGE